MQTRWPWLLEPVPVSLDAFFSRRIPDAEAWDPLESWRDQVPHWCRAMRAAARSRPGEKRE